MNARIYLGTAYMSQFIPGAQTPENAGFAAEADAEFQRALQLDPSNKIAVQSLSSLHYQLAAGIQDPAGKDRELEEARSWNQRLISIDPGNKEAYYSLGVIAWAKWFPVYSQARRRAGMKPEDPGPIHDAAIRAELAGRFTPMLEEGISDLQHALQIDPAYDDAMAYMNLLVRERADLRATREEWAADTQIADEWVNKSLENKRAKAQATPASPSRIRVGGNAQSANLIGKVDPQYPALALQARIQGTVRFTIIIDREGHIMNVQLVSGHPLLVSAAVEAVKQWVYKPTLLNGNPVEVVTTADVEFRLP